MKQLKIQVSGRVQQVGFRLWTRRTAKRLGLIGSVQNLRDRSVLVVAQGTEIDLDKFCELLKTGPSAAQVASVEVSELPLDSNLQDFSIGATVERENN